MHITTVKTRMAFIIAFLHFLVEQDLMPATALKKSIRLKLPTTLPRAIAPKDVRRLLSVIHNTRDRALILLLLRTGIRIGEALGLTLNDLDLPDRKVHLYQGEKNSQGKALHSFFRYVALHEPAMSALAQRVLAIPQKRYHRTQIQFLTRSEIEALMAAPDQETWAGRRDRTLLLVAVQTGLRVSELIGLRCEHVVLGTDAHVQCTGKGRKERCTPLRKETTAALRAWQCQLCRNQS